MDIQQQAYLKPKRSTYYFIYVWLLKHIYSMLLKIMDTFYVAPTNYKIQFFVYIALISNPWATFIWQNKLLKL
jgi:hypothetical protein